MRLNGKSSAESGRIEVGVQIDGKL